ncbi:MAG: hypothetical protein WA347_06270 [Rhabdochlamydiaceae bacterium]|jgi:hypothetical protein
MHNLILIERYLPSSFFWPNLLKDKRIAKMSVEEILNKYQGFEGDLIAFFSIKGNNSELKKIVDKCLEKKNSNNYFMLHVISGSEVMPLLLKEQAFLVGYDVGVCEEEKTIYSSIFNEILFGHLEELISYKDFLNENFLFPNRILAEKYVNLHTELSVQGKGVEDYEEMTIYEIWRHKN